MTDILVLTVIGNDKKGLVEKLSETIAINHGNWLESQVARLAEKFIGIVTFSVATEQTETIIAALNSLSELGLQVTVESATGHQEEGQLIALSVVGNDKPGIIKEVSQILHGLHVNVKELKSFCEPAPMSSEMLFKADMLLSVPPQVSLQQLEEAIETIGSDLMVDLKPKS